MAWEENSCISLNMQLIAILSRIGVIYVQKINDIAMIEAIAFVVILLFADNRDAATAMSKSCGGGGSSLESGCDKKDDEDGWKVAHRCV